MAAITGKGKWWEWRNSIWMLWAIVTMGVLSCVSFYYVGARVNHRWWLLTGAIYSLFLFLLIFALEFLQHHWLYDLIFGIYLIGWISAIIHVFRIRAEYLLRLEARLDSRQEERDMQALKNKIAKEYGLKIHPEKEVKHTPIEQEKLSQQTPVLIDINTATEEEIAKVPGIGGIFAKKVISVREEEGGFTSSDHFIEKLQVKPHLYEKMKPYLKFPPSMSAVPQPKSTGRIVDF